MYPDIVPNEGNIQLVQNSGIQFVDYDVMVDWKSKDNLSVIRAIEEGYFKKFPGSKDEPWCAWCQSSALRSLIGIL